MNTLEQFKSRAISLDSQTSIKGGIRFITTDRNACMSKINELQGNSTTFSAEKVWCAVAQEVTYCIEW